MLVRDYDYDEVLESALESTEFLDENTKKLVEEIIDKLAKIYVRNNDDDVIIPLNQILKRKISSLGILYAYKYAESKGYVIRGNDLTNVDSIDGYTRYALNHFQKLPLPFSKDEQKAKILELVELYKKMQKFAYNLEPTRYEMRENELICEKYYDLRQELIAHNMRLAYTLVHTKLSRNLSMMLPYEDLEQIAYECLCEAVDDYVKNAVKNIYGGYGVSGYNRGKSSLEYTLGTYISNSILRFKLYKIINETAYFVKIPNTILPDLLKIKNVYDKLNSELGREPTYEELKKGISSILGVSKSKVDEYLSVIMSVDSLEEQYETLEDDLYSEGLYDNGVLYDGEVPMNLFMYDVDQEVDTSLQGVLQVETRETLEKLLDRVANYMDQRTVDIIKLHFGLDDETPKTLEEVGKIFGITRERVRQIENKALAYIKKIVFSDQSGDLFGTEFRSFTGDNRPIRL